MKKLFKNDTHFIYSFQINKVDFVKQFDINISLCDLKPLIKQFRLDSMKSYESMKLNELMKIKRAIENYIDPGIELRDLVLKLIEIHGAKPVVSALFNIPDHDYNYNIDHLGNMRDRLNELQRDLEHKKTAN